MSTKYFLFILLGLLLFIPSKYTFAQPENKRFEVGFHSVFMGKFDATDSKAGKLGVEVEEFSQKVNLGTGMRFTFNVNKYLSLETEYNILPQENEYAGKKRQWFYGIKTGIRKEKFGIFYKVRPGYMYLGRNLCDEFDLFLGNYKCLGTYRKNPALDIGGVLEIYTKKNGVFRIDVGNTMVNFGHVNRYQPELGPEFNKATHIFGGKTNSLQINVGYGLRF